MHVIVYYSGTSLIRTTLRTNIIEVTLFQENKNMYLYKVGIQSSVLINQVSLPPLRGFPLIPLDCNNRIHHEYDLYESTSCLAKSCDKCIGYAIMNILNRIAFLTDKCGMHKFLE